MTGLAEERLARALARITRGLDRQTYGGLEQLGENAIDARLAELAKTGKRYCFSISTTYADTLGADGANLNRTVRPGRWWVEQIRRHFPQSVLLKGLEGDTVLILTWKPGPAGRLLIGHERRLASLARHMDRWRAKKERKRLGRNVGLAEADLFALLTGKRVALVGNAASLAETSHGADIDDHDLVIRCNRAPIVHARSHGTRTDWIATSMDFPERLLAAKGASHVLWMSPRRERMPLWLVAFPRLFLNPPEHPARLATLTGARPSTGLMAVDLLRRSPAAEIRLYGFDFFSSNTTSSDRTKQNVPHDFDAEQQLVLRWAAEDQRLRIIASAGASRAPAG